MHQRFVEIPPSLLEKTTLEALLETFVTRQGYDTTSEASTLQWVEELQQQLGRGELVILHDVETETTEVMTLTAARSFLGGLEE
ncbi:YheU family protein [Marinospirillum perlucidum]|uniref:YheU family protein n=1 Tax=Marinospirillum perlucidum TaxID=1982602 RepID=UPI000DF1E544|nr:YheU family protein [Marinospirillum perlucidum]